MALGYPVQMGLRFFPCLLECLEVRHRNHGGMEEDIGIKSSFEDRVSLSYLDHLSRTVISMSRCRYS
jgi:hypothetical protein